MGWFGGTIDDKRKECMKCSEDLAKMELAAKQQAATTGTPQPPANATSPSTSGEPKPFWKFWGGKRKSRRRRRNNRKSRKSRRNKQR